jgi:hyperosmotically inducible protein
MKRMLIGLFVAGALAAVSGSAYANDSWITTKAKLALLTTDGIHVSAPNVDTVEGKVTLHGKVESAAEKTKAAETVQKIDGVKSVDNLLQVVPQEQKKMVDANDSVIKDGVKAALKASATLKDVDVASVNKGVVLLSGKTSNLAEQLLAVETAYKVKGVQRVASEIATAEK